MPDALQVMLVIVAAVLFVAAGVMLLAFREARSLRVEHETLVVPDLPHALVGTTLVFIADVHAGPMFGPQRMARLVECANGLHADVLILGGDYVEGMNHGADVFYPAASHFSARHGVYAVLGNHDRWEGLDEARRRMAESGITLLENAASRIAIGDATLTIAGLADEWTGKPDARMAAAGVRPGDIAVLVAHNPDSFADALPATPGTWALALAGHTHGRQFAGIYRLNPHKPTRYGTRYLRRGLVAENGVPVLVSNGVGAVGAPLRFFARPQIHLITLTS